MLVPHARQPLARTRMLMMALIAILLTALAIAAPRAAAADITPSATATVTVDTTGVTGTPPTYWNWQKVTMKVTWSVPNGSQPGDYFTIPLDPALEAGSFIPFDLKDPSGLVVAKVSIDGTRVRFTLTDYVRTHRDVKGEASFQLGFDQTTLSTTVPNVLDVYNTRLRVNVDPGPDGRWDYKYGWWNDSEAAVTARDANGALTHPGPHMGWTIQLRTQVDDPARDWATLTVTETPSPGTHFDCTRRADGYYSNLRPHLGSNSGPVPTTVQVEVVSCSPRSLVLKVTKPLTDHGVYDVRFYGMFDTNAAGQPVYVDAGGNTHVGFSPDGYGNTAALNYDGWTNSVSTTLVRTAQSGSGTGVGNSPRIDIEKYSGTWDGITLRDGVPVLDESGQPASLPAGDHDAAPGLAVAAGATTPVTFRVTNIGNETLNGVTVADQTLAGTPLGPVTCTRNGSSAMPFVGVAPGESFTCTATLPAITAAHSDRATVTGVGALSGTTVTDADAWNATPTGSSTGEGTTTPTPTTAVPPASSTPSATPSGTPGTTPVTVTPPPADTPISNQQAGKPLLVISKRTASRMTRPGAKVTWTVNVRNAGGAVARQVRICDLPRAATFSGSRVTYRLAGARRTVALRVTGARGCVTIARLASGRTVSLTVVTTTAASARTRVDNTATAQATGLSPVTARASVKVRAPRPPTVSPAVTG